MAVQPSARIYIQVRETGQIIDLDRFVSVNTTINIDGISTATVRLTNKADRWYTFSSKADKLQTDISQYLKQCYDTKRINDINRKIAELLSEARRERDPSKREQKLLQVYSMEQILFYGAGYRIWIDFRGRKDLVDFQQPNPKKFNDLPDRWYAGFTGIISSIEETVKVGKEQSITLYCKDMRRFFDTTKVVTNAGFKPIIKTIADARASLNPLQSIFAGFADGAFILSYIADIVNLTFHEESGNGFYPHQRFWKLPSVIGSAEVLGTSTAFSSIVNRAYLGFSARRNLKGFANSSVETSLNAFDRIPDLVTGALLKKANKGDLMKFISKLDADKDAADVNDSIDSYQLSRYDVDKMIGVSTDKVRLNPYQQMIVGNFNFESTRVSANEVLKQVSSVTGYPIYFDAKGNLIYQKIRFDDFPAVDGDYDDPVQSQGLPFMDEEGRHDKNKIKEFGLKFHGRNYLIGDESLLGWTYRQSEDQLVTHVVVPAATDFIKLEDLANSFFSGVGLADPNIMRFAGTRILQVQAQLQKTFSRDLPQAVADGLVRKINAGFDTCSIELNSRPDLQIARTMYMIERRKLYYITKIQNNILWGRSFTTVVEGMYGHHPLQPIVDPWRQVMFGSPQSTENAVNETQKQIASQEKQKKGNLKLPEAP